MSTTLGIIGSGPVGQALARQAARAGIAVSLSNSRGPDSLADLAAGLGGSVRPATVEASAAADIVLLALPFVRVPALARRVPDWSGRTVIDATNQFATAGPYTGRADLGDETGSEWVERHLAGVKLVKAFGAMYATYMADDPRHPEGNQIVFYAGDHHDANTAVADLLGELGFAPVLVGGLRDGGKLLQLDGSLSLVHALRLP